VKRGVTLPGGRFVTYPNAMQSDLHEKG